MSKTRFKKFIPTFIFMLFGFIGLSQNEAFHGGVGDGFGFTSSAIIDMSQVSFDGNALTVTVNQASNQEDPTISEPIRYTVIFSETVNDFDVEDIEIFTHFYPENVNITGSGSIYTVEISGIQSNGQIIVQIPQGKVHNSVGNSNEKSTSIDNSINYTGGPLNVEIALAKNQGNFCNSSSVNFSVMFSEDVNNFTKDDLELSGSALPSILTITGTGNEYNVNVSGIQNDGTVILNLPENRVYNDLGVGNKASKNTGNIVNIDYTIPTVLIRQDYGQTDPAESLPLKFRLEFSEEIYGLTAEKISFGSSSGTYLQIENPISDNKNYVVNVYGLKSNETISISLDANTVYDKAGNYNSSSVNIDNSIRYIGPNALENINNNDALKIYYTENKIIVKFNEYMQCKGEVYIYDIGGRLLFKKNQLEMINTFYIPLQNSIYLVNVIVGNQKITKVISKSN